MIWIKLQISMRMVIRMIKSKMKKKAKNLNFLFLEICTAMFFNVSKISTMKQCLMMKKPHNNAKLFLKQNPSVAMEIEDKIRAANGLDFHMSEGASEDDVTEM